MIEGLKKIIRDLRESGVRLGILNNIITTLAVLVLAVLLYATYQSIEGFNSLRIATERYIGCQQNAFLFQEGSDYLTNEIRYFVMTGDAVHAQNFVEEVEVTRRRERAIDDLDDYLQENDSFRYLMKAMEYSSALAEKERYAIRLAAAGYGLDPALLPETVQSVELSAQDAALSAEEQRAQAVGMVFGNEYQEYKAHIYENVNLSINALIDDTKEQQSASSNRLNSILLRQRMLIFLMTLLLFAIVASTYVLIIRPLERGVAHIRNQQQIPVAGSSEMKFLAKTYNDIFEQQTRKTEKLTYSATHDALTGLYNRSAYESFCKSCDESALCALIVDVDEFKTFNDTYGHDMGDRVLRRVAQVLQESFRAEDFVSRIGGDEFCVIMMHANSQMRGLVERKVAAANERLGSCEDGLPSISLSVGVAFGDREAPAGDIFKDADTALYRVKREGRGSCAFY